MKKYLIPVGFAWLGFTLILGLVTTILPLTKKVQQLSDTSASVPVVQYIREIKGGSVETPDKEVVKTTVNVGEPAGEKVQSSAIIGEKK